MENIGFLIDLVLALGAAFLGGTVAQRLGLPTLAGYIVAGVLIGPNTPGFVADRERVEALANLGVAFLMFALGVEFSLNELRRVQRVALVSGGLQIPLTLALGTGTGRMLGWSWQASLLLGGAFAISSSIVAIKLLVGRGEAESPHGRIALGLGIVQDLSLVPMLALLPLLAGSENELGLALVRSLLTAAAALVLVVVVGTRLVPRLFYAIAATGSRELFLITIVLVALGTAIAIERAGLSFALGAFLAGIVVSESEFDVAVLAEIIPLRDVFSSLFFVAVGMLLDPQTLITNVTSIALILGALVVGKVLITGGAFLAAGVDHRSATLAAILMAQMGEFSFVLAGAGVAEGIITHHQRELLLAGAIGSILLVPLFLALSPTLIAVAETLPGVRAQEQAQAGADPRPGDHASYPARHVVICGYGRVGRELGEALSRRGFRYTVIELNPAIVRDLRALGVEAYYGDAGSEALLRQAGIEHARTLAIATPDLITARMAIQTARRLNPGIRIIARSAGGAERDTLGEAGADEVVQPEFEAGLEFVRRVLRWHGVSSKETGALVTRRRAVFYGDETRASDSPESG
ncbi:MAG: sodium/hydrogen exchanger [Thermomicrobiales bacterium]|nr:MAG: sodium/hydrogen exchanger [Thermomicrobiales bacterium]